MFLVIKEMQNTCESAQECYCNYYSVKSRVVKKMQNKIIGSQFSLIKITIFLILIPAVLRGQVNLLWLINLYFHAAVVGVNVDKNSTGDLSPRASSTISWAQPLCQTLLDAEIHKNSWVPFLPLWDLYPSGGREAWIR